MFLVWLQQTNPNLYSPVRPLSQSGTSSLVHEAFEELLSHLFPNSHAV